MLGTRDAPGAPEVPGAPEGARDASGARDVREARVAPDARVAPGAREAHGSREAHRAREARDAGAAPDLPDAVRVLLLHAANVDARTAARLYAHGTGAERRAVLLALPYLRIDGADAVPLVEDALRTNDTRLVAAAVGLYAARHLSPHSWRQAVLKCLFTGVPLTAVADWERRARGDAELARMLTAYARERTAAGRPVPGDLDPVLARTRAPLGEEPLTRALPREEPLTRVLSREASLPRAVSREES
ncbi:EboA domain-containing protein [Streptomyces sp. NPDC044780]|uniref:EboA domain-containing protein n=1 Tax=unclassified Streptomyces TaxID=2593676 RepID=UPI0033E32AD5